MPLPQRIRICQSTQFPFAISQVTALAVLLACTLGATPAAASLYLECPCEVESDGTTFTITVGARSYRSTNSGALHVGVIVYDDPDRPEIALGQVQMTE